MDPDAYALAVNAQLVERDLYPAISVQPTADRNGTQYLLLLLGGIPLVHAKPALLAEIVTTWDADAPMTALDLWNAFAPYRREKKFVYEDAPGVWDLGCGACRTMRTRVCPFGA